MGLLKENERSAEKAAAKVMAITAAIFVLVPILDIVGIFVVDLITIFIAFIVGSVFLLIPTIIVRVAKATGNWVKYVIVTCSIMFTMVLTITLSFHAVLLFVYPIGIASLFFSSKLNIFATIVTIISVSLGQYICYVLELVKDDNFTDMKRLILFGILPRAIILVAVSAIFTMLCKRTSSMLSTLMGAEQQQMMREKSLEVSHKLLNTVTELDTIARSSAQANRSISNESANVLRDSDANFHHIKSVEDNMTEISASLVNLSDMSNKISELTDKADEITAENNEKIALASRSMDEINKGSDESRAIISRLNEQSAQIVDIVKVITNISSQTNILAINASIEAQRAGEAGRSFAVVAGEIKNLSEKTNSAAEQISDIIEQVIGNISGTVKAIEKSSQLTHQGLSSMEEMKRSAQLLSEANSEISRNIAEMNRVIGAVTANGSTVSNEIVSVSKNIESNCGAVQQVADAIRENSAGTEKLGDMVNDIKIMAEEIEQLTQ